MKKIRFSFVLALAGSFIIAFAPQGEVLAESAGNFRLLLAEGRIFGFQNGVDRYELVFENLSKANAKKYVQIFVAPHQGKPVILGLGLTQSRFVEQGRVDVQKFFRANNPSLGGAMGQDDYVYNFSDDYSLSEASLNVLVSYDRDHLKSAYINNEYLDGSTHFVDFTDLFKIFRPGSDLNGVDSSEILIPLSFKGESPSSNDKEISLGLKTVTALFGERYFNDTSVQRSNFYIFDQVFKGYEISEPIHQEMQRVRAQKLTSEKAAEAQALAEKIKAQKAAEKKAAIESVNDSMDVLSHLNK